MLPGIIVPCSFRENEWFYPFYPGRRKRKKKRKKRKRKHKDLNPPRSYPAFGVFVMLGFGATWAKAGSWADMMLRTEAKTSESTGLKVVTVLTSIQKFQFLSNSFSLFRCGQATLRRTPRMPRKWRRTWWPGYGEVVLQIAKGRCCFGRGCWEATSRKIHSRKVCQAQGETTRSVSVKYFTSDFLRAWTPGGCVEIPATWKMKVKKSYLSIAFHCTLEPGTCPWLAWLLMTPPCVCETKCFFSCVWSEFGSHTGHFDVFCFMWLLAEALKVWEGTVPVAKETWFMHGFKSGSPANISSVYHSQWSCHGFMPIEVNKNTLSVLNCIIRYYSYIRTHTHMYIYIYAHIHTWICSSNHMTYTYTYSPFDDLDDLFVFSFWGWPLR